MFKSFDIEMKANGGAGPVRYSEMEEKMASQTLWAKDGTYPPRQGNEIRILIDGQAAYGEIAAAFHGAKEFIYLTLSYGSQDFLPVPASNEAMFDILRSRRKDGVDVRMVVWQPAEQTADTIPDPSPGRIAGVNDGLEAFKPAGTRRKVIAAGIGRLMVISSLSTWIFLHNWDAIIRRPTSWTTAQAASWPSLAASIRSRHTGTPPYTTLWMFDAWRKG